MSLVNFEPATRRASNNLWWVTAHVQPEPRIPCWISNN